MQTFVAYVVGKENAHGLVVGRVWAISNLSSRCWWRCPLPVWTCAPPRCPFSYTAVSVLARWSFQVSTSAVAACPTSAAPSEVLLMWVCSLILLPYVRAIGSVNNSSLVILHVGVHFWLVLPLSSKFWSVHTAGNSGGGDGGIPSGPLGAKMCSKLSTCNKKTSSWYHAFQHGGIKPAKQRHDDGSQLFTARSLWDISHISYSLYPPIQTELAGR
jgi:hypothetical protein